MTEYDKSVVNALPFIVQDFFWLENQSLTDKILHDEPMGDFERLTLPTFDLYERTVASFGAVSNRSPDVLNYEALLTLLYIGYINEKIPKKISEDYNPDSIFVLSYDEENAVDLTKVVYKNQEEKEALEEEAEENEDEESDKEDDAKAAEEMGSFIVNDEGSSSESAGSGSLSESESGSSSESNSEGSESEFETSTENEQEEEVVEQEEEVVEPNIKPSGHLVYYVKGEGFAPEDVYLKKAYIMIYVWLFAKTKFNELTTLLQQVEDYESSEDGSDDEESDEEEGASGDVSSGSVSSDSDEEFKSEVPVAVGKSKRELPKRQRKERYTREKIQQFAAETEEVNKDVRRELKGKPSKKEAAKIAELEAKRAEANAVREAKKAEANAIREAKRAEANAIREAKRIAVEAKKADAIEFVKTSQTEVNNLLQKAKEEAKADTVNKIKADTVNKIKDVLGNINYLVEVLTTTEKLTEKQIERFKTNAKTYLVQAKNYLKPPEEKTKKPKQRKK